MKKISTTWRSALTDEMNVNFEKLEFQLDQVKRMYNQKLGRTKTMSTNDNDDPENTKIEDINKAGLTNDILDGLVN